MIDPNEAPEGYVAVMPVDGWSCEGCAFFCPASDCTSKHDESCFLRKRQDGHHVIFIKREKVPAPAAYSASQVREILFDTFDTLHRLRDEFAKAELAATYVRQGGWQSPDGVALDCYRQADAMLAAKFATMTWGKK